MFVIHLFCLCPAIEDLRRINMIGSMANGPRWLRYEKRAKKRQCQGSESLSYVGKLVPAQRHLSTQLPLRDHASTAWNDVARANRCKQFHFNRMKPESRLAGKLQC
jgi:hypothetical protein